MMHREITFFLLHQALPSSATVAASCGLTSHIFQNLAEPVEPSPGEQNEVTHRFGSQKSFKRMACLLQGKQGRNGFPQKHKVLARLLPSVTDRNASMPTEQRKRLRLRQFNNQWKQHFVSRICGTCSLRVKILHLPGMCFPLTLNSLVCRCLP